MTLPKCSWVLFLALAATNSLAAAEITGKVRDTSGNTATVAIDGDALPVVGDSVEIFFKLAGAGEDVLVASGKVAALEAKLIKVKIENATGTVAPDQLARIKSGSSPTTAGASPSRTSSSIVGDWVGPDPDGRPRTVSFSFKEDGAVMWQDESEKYAEAVHAKYRIDPSTQPYTIEFFEFDRVADPKDGKNIFGIFELQSDGRLKLEFQKGPAAPPLKEFSKDALILSKATSPLVRSNKPPFPMPTPYVAPITPPDEKLIEEGKDLSKRKDHAGAIKAYTKAIELNPKNANAFFWRGSCYSEMKDESAAIADYEKALELDPTMHRLLRNLIDAMKQERLDREVATESPPPATPTVSPERPRKKAKVKP